MFYLEKILMTHQSHLYKEKFVQSTYTFQFVIIAETYFHLQFHFYKVSIFLLSVNAAFHLPVPIARSRQLSVETKYIDLFHYVYVEKLKIRNLIYIYTYRYLKIIYQIRYTNGYV